MPVPAEAEGEAFPAAPPVPLAFFPTSTIPWLTMAALRSTSRIGLLLAETFHCRIRSRLVHSSSLTRDSRITSQPGRTILVIPFSLTAQRWFQPGPAQPLLLNRTVRLHARPLQRSTRRQRLVSRSCR